MISNQKKERNFLIFTVLFLIFIVLIGFSFNYFYFAKKINTIANKIKTLEKQSVNNFAFQKQTTENKQNKEKIYQPVISQEKIVISIVKSVSPSVVSIIETKDLPVYETYYEEFFGFEIPQYKQKGTEKKEVAWGTGFIVSDDGLILTNRHVVSDKEAEYTVLMNNGKEYKAEVVARDKFKDIALLKVKTEKKLKPLKLGDSSKLQIGQSVIAIGNALGEFQNTVSVGVISGLGRKIIAGQGSETEVLENVIQTDAAINRGNSGGPLLNLKGEVIGINTAVAIGAENIGFAIPINYAKIDLAKYKKFGAIIYPYLGVWYWNINPSLQKEMDLPVDHGAWITRWNKDKYGHWYKSEKPAVIPGTPAEKAGLKENDIILEFNHEVISKKNSLSTIIQKYNPGDKVQLKILRDGKIFDINVTLGKRN